MLRRRSFLYVLLSVPLALLVLLPGCAASTPLRSWNDTPHKQAIIHFVERVSGESSPDRVPEAERIVVFDNDGTLWCEHPMYVQLAFAIDRVRALAPQHPEWKTTEPFKSILDGDIRAALAEGEKSVFEVIAATHAGMTTAEFNRLVQKWLATAEHPRFKRPYTDLTYQPMVELMDYLRANGFKVYIVSGGGVGFMRPWTDPAYGVPPEQVIGSSLKTKWEIREGGPVLVQLPEVNSIDDKEGKPININLVIGRRPIFAFGNSDGDLQMLEWTAAGDGPNLALLVHHDDAEREYAYDRKADFGRLDKAWDAAVKRGWIVVSMKNDWKTIFPE